MSARQRAGHKNLRLRNQGPWVTHLNSHVRKWDRIYRRSRGVAYKRPTTAAPGVHGQAWGSAGNGYTEPFEEWLNCTCGALVWSRVQGYPSWGSGGEPGMLWLEHMHFVNPLARRPLLHNGRKGRK